MKRGNSVALDTTPPKIIKLSSGSESDDNKLGKVQLTNHTALKEAIASQNIKIDLSNKEPPARKVDTSQGLMITAVNEKAASSGGSSDLKPVIEAIKSEVCM